MSNSNKSNNRSNLDFEKMVVRGTVCTTTKDKNHSNINAQHQTNKYKNDSDKKKLGVRMIILSIDLKIQFRDEKYGNNSNTDIPSK
jgi:hypothetical protein